MHKGFYSCSTYVYCILHCTHSVCIRMYMRVCMQQRDECKLMMEIVCCSPIVVNNVLYCIALYCIALHCIALHCIVLYCIALHCIVLYCIALHCIALYCIVLHCIALHCMYCLILLYCVMSPTVLLRCSLLGEWLVLTNPCQVWVRAPGLVPPPYLVVVSQGNRLTKLCGGEA